MSNESIASIIQHHMDANNPVLNKPCSRLLNERNFKEISESKKIEITHKTLLIKIRCAKLKL